jgi:nucleoside 2-deoxyribosyltransferase
VSGASSPQRVYLAGPEVFLPDASAVLARKAAMVRAAGLAPLLPVDEQAGRARDTADLAAGIYAGNLALLDVCDLLIANLTPFRGPGADPGTVFELGYVAARGRPVHAYSADTRDLAARVRDGIGAAPDGRGVLRDPDDLLVEDFGRAENLMPAIACERAGGDVVRVRADPGGPAARIAATDGLAACLARIVEGRARMTDAAAHQRARDADGDRS